MGYANDGIDGMTKIANAIKELAKTRCRHMWEPPKTMSISGHFFYGVQVCRHCNKTRKL